MYDIKSKLKDLFKQKYLLNHKLSEVDIAREDLNFLLAILEEYGSFYNFEKELGFLSRHIKEREKYSLYQTLLKRYELYEEEALRPAKIEKSLSDEIIKHFGAIINLTKKMILNTNDDTVLYNAHTYFLKGHTINTIKDTAPELYAKIIEHFGSLVSFSHVYQKKLFLNPLKEFVSQGETIDVNFGLTSKNISEIEAAKLISVPDIIDFLFINKLQDESLIYIKNNYPVYYLAIEMNGGIDAIRALPKYTEVYNLIKKANDKVS